MRTLLILLEKEFRQVFRNPAILRVMFMVPTVQLLVMPWAADYEVKQVNLCIVDQDHSDYSRGLVSKVTATDYFRLVDYSPSYNAALQYIERDEADVVLQIPPAFEKDLIREDRATVFMALNAINGVKANLGGAYLRNIVTDFDRDIRTELIGSTQSARPPQLEIVSNNWFNPLLNYRYFMVPGILVILVTMVGGFLSALNIVKEKEVGTIEQINVTPIKKYQFILGKLIPFWILGLIVLSIGLLISWLVYGITPAGSLGTIYLFAAVYLLAVLGLGLLMSTVTSTQQQAMLLAFFMMMIFILLGGLFTSIESMPVWAQVFTKVNPVSYFIDVMRMVILKGSDLYDIRFHLLKVFAIAVVLNTLATISYRKRS